MDWLGQWAMNLMLINVSTRRFGCAVRPPEGDIAARPAKLDLLAIQIDGILVTGERTLLAAIGSDGEGAKHPLGLLEGATENAAVMEALLDNPIQRGWIRRSVVCSSSTDRRR